LLGALLLIILGVAMAKITVYPFSFMLRARRVVGALLECRGRKQSDVTREKSEEIEEMKEVDIERRQVQKIIQPVLVENMDVDAESNNAPPPTLSYALRNSHQDHLPPVIMHKLRKVFPSLGGAPQKVRTSGGPYANLWVGL